MGKDSPWILYFNARHWTIACLIMIFEMIITNFKELQWLTLTSKFYFVHTVLPRCMWTNLNNSWIIVFCNCWCGHLQLHFPVTLVRSWDFNILISTGERYFSFLPQCIVYYFIVNVITQLLPNVLGTSHRGLCGIHANSIRPTVPSNEDTNAKKYQCCACNGNCNNEFFSHINNTSVDQMNYQNNVDCNMFFSPN